MVVYNGTSYSNYSIKMTKGATALGALERVTSVKTEHYNQGEYITAIAGLEQNKSAQEFWMWYYWNKSTSTWEMASFGAGSYELKNGDEIKFSYEKASW